MLIDAYRFARAAHTLNTAATARGLEPVSFRSPPRVGDRSLRRRRDGAMVVAVRRTRRPDADVVDDMVAGLLAANRTADAALAAELARQIPTLTPTNDRPGS